MVAGEVGCTALLSGGKSRSTAGTRTKGQKTRFQDSMPSSLGVRETSEDLRVPVASETRASFGYLVCFPLEGLGLPLL